MLTGLSKTNEDVMTKLRSTFIKIFSFAFAVCVVFAIATIPQAKTATAADAASFKMNGTSIYKYNGEDEGKVGLRFEAEFNKAWIDKYPAEKYTFGMIIAPTANFSAWDENLSPTANMEAVDGANIIRIQNSALTAGATISASILFDDNSLKIAIADKLKIDISAVTDAQIKSLKGYIFEQGYSAVAYMVCGETIEYLDRYDTSMRETATRTFVLGVAENNADYKALALDYLNLSKDDVYTQSAYVTLTDKKLVIDSAESFEIKEGDLIFADGKVLDYDIVNNEVILKSTKPSKTVETIVILRDTDINVVELTYVDVALSTSADVVDFFMNKDNFVYSEANTAHYNSKTAVLANDIDMSEVIVYNLTPVYFFGMFDGRGHVLSNVTLKVVDDANTKNSTYGLFGIVEEGGIIKNVAFNEIKSIDHCNNGGVLGYALNGLLENVYLSYSVANKSKTGMFVLAVSGVMRNVVVVDNYYDSNFDADAYIEENVSSWGVSPIVRSITDDSATFENVQVISHRPINYTATGSDKIDVVYTTPIEDDPDTEDVDESKAATVSSWGASVVYAENETKLWVDFEYFYRPVNDFYTPGLGLTKGTANVENTKDCNKTIVKQGVRRYDDIESFLQDEANAENRTALIKTGFWKEVDGDIVWANDAN